MTYYSLKSVLEFAIIFSHHNEPSKRGNVIRLYTRQHLISEEVHPSKKHLQPYPNLH